MAHVEIEQRIEASAENVWDCYLGSRAEELAIGVYAESITTTGQGVGAVRTSVLLGGAGILRERIDVFDALSFVCRYSIIERGPLPFADYKGQISISPQGASACVLKLQADFTPVGLSEADSISLYLANNHAGIARMKLFLGIG